MNGHLFGNRYQAGDTIGFGGMSEVYHGRDLRMGRDVAIKVLRPDLARDPSFQTRFRREAQNAASLNHPAIVAVYDTGDTETDTGTIPYIVMEYVDGVTLRDRLRRGGVPEPARALEIVAQICAALDFSHQHGIVHRDVKPANVMLDQDGAVKVMDFGIARATADAQVTMTNSAAVLGTAQYLAPEQARGEAVDARSDVYATGCVLFELLTGVPPFVGDSALAVVYQHVREAPKVPSEVNAAVPKELDPIVLKALAKDPAGRHQTAAEMQSDLVRALSGASALLPIGAAPAVDLPQGSRSRSSKIWGAVAIGVVCAVLLAGAIMLTLKVTHGGSAVAQVATPQVQGLTLAQAANTLAAVGLRVGSKTDVQSATIAVGSVVKQNPSDGTPIEVGRAVDLQVSVGITSVTVPDLIGASPQEAQAQLAKVDLAMKSVVVASTDDQKNRVIAQDPKVNSSIRPGTTVTVQIGAGADYTMVPRDLVGKSYRDAVTELSAAGLKAIAERVDGTAPADRVLRLSGVAPGSAVAVGTPVTLQISNNQLFVMPDLAYQTVDDAAATLTRLGWIGKTGSAIRQFHVTTNDSSIVGLIAGDPQIVYNVQTNSTALTPQQSPAAGSTARKSAQITVLVYTGTALEPTNVTMQSSVPSTTATSTTSAQPPTQATSPATASSPVSHPQTTSRSQAPPTVVTPPTSTTSIPNPTTSAPTTKTPPSSSTPATSTVPTTPTTFTPPSTSVPAITTTAPATAA